LDGSQATSKNLANARVTTVISSSVTRPIAYPTFDLRIVLVLSIMTYEMDSKPLSSVGKISMRESGASTTSVVSGSTDIE
jgi:hypothetical protein